MPQDDVLLPTLTVGEHLLMHAMLRLPATLTPQQAQVGGDACTVPARLRSQHGPLLWLVRAMHPSVGLAIA